MQNRNYCTRCGQNYKCQDCNYDCCDCPMGGCAHKNDNHRVKAPAYDQCKKPVYHTIGALPKV